MPACPVGRVQTKAHGGEIKVESLPTAQAANEIQEAKTKFGIHLPLS